MSRPVKALGVIAALLAGSLCIDACLGARALFSDLQSIGAGGAGGSTPSAASSHEGYEADAGAAFPDPVFPLSGLSGNGADDAFLGGSSPKRLPDAFEEEVFSVAGFYEVRTDETDSVVGLLSHAPADEVFAACKAELKEKGWVAIESGQARMETYIKDEGRFTWMLVSCLSVSGDTSIVVQIA